MSEPDRRTLRRNIRELPGVAWLLVGGSFVNRFGSFVVPFLVLYMRGRGFSIAASGSAVAAYGFGEVVAGPLGGHLADRIGRRLTIVSATFASAAAIIVLYSVHAYGAILAVAFLTGLVTESRRPASLALLSDVVPQGQRVTVYAVLRFAENLAFAGGLALGGFLANHSFLWLFVGDAASSVVYGLVALFGLPEGRRTPQKAKHPLIGYRAILADRAFLVFLGCSFLVFFVYFQSQATLPLHVRSSGLSNADYGLLLALNGALVVLFELPLSSLTMRFPPKRMIAAGFLLVGLGFSLVSVSHTFLALAITVCVWTAGEMVASPVSYAYVADLAPEDMRGRYQGLYGLVFGSGAVVGPAVGTALLAWSVTGFWTLCGILALAAALIVLAHRPVRALGPTEAILVPEAEPRTPGPRL